MAQPSVDSVCGFPLKLLVDEKKKKVIFAEAGKQLVDFFFSLSLLPLGAAVSLLGKDGFPGSIGELHDSICKLDSPYFYAGPATSPSEVKEELILSTSLARQRLTLGNLFPRRQPDQKSRVRQLKVYLCNSCRNNASDVFRAKCPSCRYFSEEMMTREINLELSSPAVGGDEKKEGFVKELVTYAITDDLSIAPLSTISSLAIMKKLHANDLALLQEKTVIVGVEQAVKILGISLRSKTVLSEAFLSKD